MGKRQWVVPPGIGQEADELAVGMRRGWELVNKSSQDLG